MRYPKFYQQQIAITVRAFKTNDIALLNKQLKFFKSWKSELELCIPLLEAMAESLPAAKD